MITILIISLAIFTLNITLDIVKTLKKIQQYETKKKREDELFNDLKIILKK